MVRGEVSAWPEADIIMVKMGGGDETCSTIPVEKCHAS